jgi:hypothetical protein
MEIIAGWILAGKSGSVVGPAGAGKSNLLGFLCHRPDALQLYLPATTDGAAFACILVDLNDLPAYDLATLYRIILRSFYEARSRFSPSLGEAISQAYKENRAVTDPFVSQSALRELLFLFLAQSMRIFLVLDRFDQFCQKATAPMTDTLRALRDSFKGILCYLVGMRQEISYLSDPAVLGELYEILDTHVCRVRPLAPADARHLALRELGERAAGPAGEEVVDNLLAATGGYPALHKAACHWWLKSAGRPASEWLDAMMAEPTIGHRLEELWSGLSQEEQLALSEVQKGQAGGWERGMKRAGDRAAEGLQKRFQPALALLADKGLLQQRDEGWHITGELLVAFVASAAGRGRGRIWVEPESGTIYQGQSQLDNLSPLERSLLAFLLGRPRIRHTYTTVIQAAWPAEVAKEGVSTEALFQLVAGLRRKIEPDPSRPCYLVNWRGTPEGGYQCFPEGRPE